MLGHKSNNTKEIPYVYYKCPATTDELAILFNEETVDQALNLNVCEQVLKIFLILSKSMKIATIILVITVSNKTACGGLRCIFRTYC